MTAKARIRDAATQLFGEVGYERATTHRRFQPGRGRWCTPPSSWPVGMLAGHVSRGLQTDITTPEGEQLLLRALLDLYSDPLLTAEQAAHHGAQLAATHRPRRDGDTPPCAG